MVKALWTRVEAKEGRRAPNTDRWLLGWGDDDEGPVRTQQLPHPWTGPKVTVGQSLSALKSKTKQNPKTTLFDERQKQKLFTVVFCSNNSTG